MPGGRYKSGIWSHFEEKKSIGKAGSRAVCKKCKKELQGLVDRLKKHYRSCVESLSETDTSTSTSNDDSVNNDYPPAKRMPMSDFVCSTSQFQKNKLDKSIAETIAGCNLPFRLLGHPLFIKLCNELRPGYVPPSRFVLADKLIPDLYEFHQNENKQVLKGVPVCLAVDGWQNIRKEPIICTTITRDSGEAYLVTTVDTTGLPHTAENLEKLGTLCDSLISEYIDNFIVYHFSS